MSVARRAGLAAYFPKHLNTYKRCPQRYFLQYVRKRPGRVVDTSAMVRGSVAHNVLRQAFVYFRAHNGFPAGLDKRITERLPVDNYAGHDRWRRDVTAIIDWVDYAVETFDTRKSVLTVEQVYAYPMPRLPDQAGEPPSFLKAKVDLVLKHDDGVIEHVDWKTGKRGWADEIQNVAARITVGKALQERRVVSTVTYLAATNEADDSSELSLQEVREGWNAIKGIATSICADDEWVPIQSGLCYSCPYYQHGCKLHRAPDADASRQRLSSNVVGAVAPSRPTP